MNCNHNNNQGNRFELAPVDTTSVFGAVDTTSVFGASSNPVQSLVDCTTPLKSQLESSGMRSLLGSFVILGFSNREKRWEIFLFIPSTRKGTLYYAYNNGLKVRSVFIEFIILVLKELK